MAKLGRVLAGLGAIAGGYVQGDRMLKEDQRREERDQREREDYEARKAERERIANERITLANAAKPAEVQPLITNDDDGNPTSAPPVRLSAGGEYKSFADPAAAQTAATEYNKTSPYDRQAQVLREQGKPAEALTLENAAWTQGRSRTLATREDEAYAKRLKDEGVADAWKALHRGDAQGMVEAFNKSGQYKIDPASVRMVPEEREIPGLGKRKTWTATMTVQTPDGKTVQKSFNSHDLGTALLPYKDMLDLDFKAAKEARESKKTDSDITLAGAHADYYKKAGDALTTRATNAGGKPDRMNEDDKIAYQDANTRVRDAEKNLTTAMSNLAGADPAKDPGVQFAQRALAQAKRHQFQTAVRVGQITPEAIATDVIGAAKNPQEVLASLNELATTVGPEFSDRVGALVQSSDAWKQMNRGKAQPGTPQGRAIADAPPGSVTLDQSGRYVPTASGAAPVTLAGARTPRDPLAGRVIGRLTPMADIEASAAAGNPEAIAYLQRRQRAELENLTAPASAADMLVR